MAKRIVEKKEEPVEGKHSISGKRKALYIAGGFMVALVLTGGIFAQNDWFPRTDPLSGERYGWFGVKFNEHAKGSNWNPFAEPAPSTTPQLSKELIYVGDQLLAIEDPGAPASPASDFAVWRNSTNTWWILSNDGQQHTAVVWGQGSDTPLSADFNADGKSDLCVYREIQGNPSQWWILYTSDYSYSGVAFGQEGDVPVPADYDGDGQADLAVYRPGTSPSEWHVYQSSDSAWMIYQFGLSSDEPTPADFDGDGKADIAFWRDSDQTYYTINSSDSSLNLLSVGSVGDKPVVEDYDGDGRADAAVYRPSNNTWYILQSSNGQTITHQLGTGGDELVPADYDSDGKADVAVWRVSGSNGIWNIKESSTSAMKYVYWGSPNDKPIPMYHKW